MAKTEPEETGASRRRRLAWGAVQLPGWLAVLVIFFCAPDAHATKPVHVGVFQVEPLTFVKNGKPDGLFIDLLEEVAAAEGWELKYTSGTFEEQFAALKRGDLDLMPTIAWSAERVSQLDYNKEPVITLWGEVFVREGAKLRGLLELNNRRVALMTSDINGRNFRDHVKKFDVDCDFVELDTLDEVFAAVRDGKADAGVAPNIYGYRHGADFGVVSTSIVFSPIAVHFAAAKGRSAPILAGLDRALSDWKSRENSVYRQRLNFWFGGDDFSTKALPSWVLWGLLGGALLTLTVILYAKTLDSRVRQRTEELERSERRFRALFDNQFQLSGVLRPDGTLLEANAASLALVGTSIEAVRGRPFWECPWWSHDAALSNQIQQAVGSAAQGKFVRFDAQHVTPKGEVRHIDFSIKPVLDAEGRVELLIPEGRDITERRTLEEHLRQAQKLEAVGTLAGGIAHDFNNILTAIAGSAEIARQEIEEDSPIREDLDCIAQGTHRARELVQQILTFSRKRPIHRGPVNLADVIEETHALLRSTFPKSITIIRDLQTQGPVIGDAMELQRLLMNLGTNALHAMPEGGQLTFHLSEREARSADGVSQSDKPGRYVLLGVEDTGIGIAPDEIGKIFEPYYTTKDPTRGTGLGLAVVHGVVRELGGWIHVESAQGRGSRFEIWLPLDERKVSASIRLPEAAKTSGSERLIVIDDEPANVKVIANGLRRLGYRVEGHTSAAEGIAAVSRSPSAIDAVLVDLTMPERSGLDVARTLRELAGPELVIVLWSGLITEATSQAAQKIPVDLVVNKPISPKELARELRKVLEHKLTRRDRSAEDDHSAERDHREPLGGHGP